MCISSFASRRRLQPAKACSQAVADRDHSDPLAVSTLYGGPSTGSAPQPQQAPQPRPSKQPTSLSAPNLLWLVAQIALAMFAVETGLMLAFFGGDLTRESARHGLLDAASLTLICAPIIYIWIVRPFVAAMQHANERVSESALALQAALRQKQAQAASLTAALSRLRLQTAAIDRLALISETDARGVIIDANEEFCAVSGYTRGELIGKTHSVINSGLHPKTFWKDMYATLAKGEVWQAEVRNRRKDGTFYWVRSANVAMRDDAGRLSGYLSLRFDVTESKRQQQQLERQQQQLDAQKVQLETALNNMRDGLSMFDAEQRLVVCNGTYREIYSLPDALTQPGTAFSEIVHQFAEKEASAAPSQMFEDVQKWIRRHVEQLALGKAACHTHYLSDGRIILVHSRPLAAGGWVDVHQDITDKCRAEARILHLAHHDALTQLPNRLVLDERLRPALSSTACGGRFALLLLDLDDFKEVNDTLGHPVGDQLLQAVADRLRQNIRDADTAVRMGGDEFALLVASAIEPDKVREFAQRLIEVVSMPYEIDGHHIAVGTSIGIVVAPDDGETAEELIKNADLALYRAKSEGRGRYCFYDAELHERARAARLLRADPLSAPSRPANSSSTTSPSSTLNGTASPGPRRWSAGADPAAS